MFFFEKRTFENQCLLYINKTIYLIYITHSTTKQDNLSYTNKTIYYIKIRRAMLRTCPQGLLFFLKNSVCVFSAPAGAFIFPKTSVCVFGAPAGAFIWPNKTPLDGQGWLWDGRVADRAAGGAGGELGRGADSQVCRLFSYRSERNHSFRRAS